MKQETMSGYAIVIAFLIDGAIGEYKDDPLKTGEAVTNPGKLEK